MCLCSLLRADVSSFYFGSTSISNSVITLQVAQSPDRGTDRLWHNTWRPVKYMQNIAEVFH